MDVGNFIPLSPVSFFALRATCHYWPKDSKNLHGEKYALPDTSDLCNEKSFAQVMIGWNEDGIRVAVKVEGEVGVSRFPVVTDGDAVELFFDTRDVKTSGFNTRFCHHFFFLPQEADGHIAGEITRFRTDDRHEYCAETELTTTTTLGKKGYTMQLFIPAHCLVGYDPQQFPRLGFSYRISSKGGRTQHFSVNTQEFTIEQQPALWSSLELIK